MIFSIYTVFVLIISVRKFSIHKMSEGIDVPYKIFIVYNKVEVDARKYSISKNIY